MGYYNKNLDEIDFKLYEPTQELKPYIFNYWYVKKSNIKNKITHKVLSDGNMGISINFKSPYSVHVNNKDFNCRDNFIVNGVTKYPSYISFEKSLEILGIRFNPAGAYIFFEEKIESFVDKHTSIKDSFSWRINDLYMRLLDTVKIEDKIIILEEFLIQKLNTSIKKNISWMFSLIQMILDHKGKIEISTLCKNFNITQRHLERKFKEEMGLSPKLYIRIIRLQHVKSTLSSLPLNNLTKTAYETGFSDQAHFIKEFKFFMNETPKSYANEKLSQAKINNFRKYNK